MNKELFLARLEAEISDYVDEANQLNSTPRLRTPRPATDIDGFFILVDQALKKQQEVEGVTHPVAFSEDFPEEDDNITRERITFSIKSRKPGTFEQVNVGLAGADRRTRARTRMLRESENDPDQPGSKIFTFGQEYDNWVVFNIWAMTNKTANRRATWFENFMEDWRWYFEANGVKRVLYSERMEDVHLSPNNRKLVCRPLCYYVRTEKITHVREYVLRAIVTEGSLE